MKTVIVQKRPTFARIVQVPDDPAPVKPKRRRSRKPKEVDMGAKPNGPAKPAAPFPPADPNPDGGDSG